MSITTLKVTDDKILGNYEVNFAAPGGHQVHYLVGNNGSGKTRVLDLTYQALMSADHHLILNDQASVNVELQADDGSSVNYFIRGSGQGWDPTVTTEGDDGSASLIKWEDRHKPIDQIVYISTRSDVDQNAQSIGNEQRDVLDSGLAKSRDLHKEIPRLLVELDERDQADIAEQFHRQGRQVVAGSPIDLRIDRFKDAYRSFTNGSKTFKETRQIDQRGVVIFEDADGMECELSSLSSGEKQVVYRLGFALQHIDPSINGGIILIDEPELSLHPEWQARFIKALQQLFGGNQSQLVVATHSPFIFESFDPSLQECIRIDRSQSRSEVIELDSAGSTSAPSPAFVAYKAFGVWTEALHIELFDKIMMLMEVETLKRLHAKLTEPPRSLTPENRSISGSETFGNGRVSADEVLPIWVRNQLHHPDEQDRKVPTLADKKQSVDLLLQLLRSPNSII